MQEFKAETEPGRREMELGDVFFSLINYARLQGINPDAALERTNQKFIRRFQQMEQLAVAQKTSVADLTIEEMDALWEEAKKQESK